MGQLRERMEPSIVNRDSEQVKEKRFTGEESIGATLEGKTAGAISGVR